VTVTRATECFPVAAETLDDLHRLIDALDRRVPRSAALREAKIADDAADLRTRAVTLIRQIEDRSPRTLIPIEA
jgi:hypothetical protein